MTLTALKADAKEKGIKGYSAMKKDDLIEVLKHLA
ncbi:MAG: Rho termination factor N-terminal domain-containing protein [Erysipelotrichales bacterium]|nr:Rho termination factor N-terminal domain-containing protein [Erysipelotrichales bacterium]